MSYALFERAYFSLVQYSPLSALACRSVVKWVSRCPKWLRLFRPLLGPLVPVLMPLPRLVSLLGLDVYLAEKI